MRSHRACGRNELGKYEHSTPTPGESKPDSLLVQPSPWPLQ